MRLLLTFLAALVNGAFVGRGVMNLGGSREAAMAFGFAAAAALFFTWGLLWLILYEIRKKA